MGGFDGVLGNDDIKRAMAAAITHGRIAPAYIIAGEGADPAAIGLAFARAIVGDAAENHPDIIFVRGAKKSIGTADIREQILAAAHIKPYSGARSVFIVEEACGMSIAAQNALLKTLEDGPPHAVFLLLSKNPGAFLPTVLSRCVLFKLSTAARIKSENDGEILQIVLNALGGIAAQFAAARAMETYKDNIYAALDVIMWHFRDKMVADMDIAAARKIRIVEDIKTKLKQNCNFLLAMEVMFLRLARER